MNRLLLEIYPERGNGGGGDLPPILIATGENRVSLPAGEEAGAPVVLRLNETGLALQPSAGDAGQPLDIGQWHNAGGWRVRVTHAVHEESGMTVVDNPSWAAPEIRILTPDGDRTKQLRCVLPTEEGSQLVLGRGGEGTDLIVEDEHVSRVHLRFFIKDGRRMVEDLKSRWGTKLNGKPLMGAAPIQHGDEVRIGKSTIQYVCYWEVLPSGGQESQRKAIRSEPTAVSTPELEEASVGETPKAIPEAKAAKTQAAEQKPPAAEAVKKEEVAPATPPPEKKEEVKEVKPEPGLEPSPTPAATPPPGRSWLGFDVIGAVAIVILVIAGLLYLAKLVFTQH